MTLPPSVLTSLLGKEGPCLEYVKATVTAKQLASSIDLLRTPNNEITLIAGHTVENQVWQSVRVFSEDPSIHVVLSVGPDIVGGWSVGDGRQYLAKMRLVTLGSTVRCIARSAATTAAVQIVVEIFGWGVTEAMLPFMTDALCRMDAS